MDQFTNIYKLLSDETRLRILLILLHKKLCVCQLQGILVESQPKISKHLGKLRDLGVVRDERKEQFIFYYLNEEQRMLKEILETTLRYSESMPVIQQDLIRLEQSDAFIQNMKNSSIH